MRPARPTIHSIRGLFSSAPRTHTLYRALSACALGDHTAGPRLRLSTLNWIPARSVVIPGSQAKEFSAGTFHTPCALIIGQRKASTDKKTSLNDVLRTFDVQV